MSEQERCVLTESPGSLGPKTRLFLFHWNDPEAAAWAVELAALGWSVDYQAKDGARGAGAVLAGRPDVVVISLTRLPSHGRQTAFYLQKQKKLATPIIFVGGAGEALEKTKAKIPNAIYTTETELADVLGRIANKSAESRGRTKSVRNNKRN